MSQFSFVQFLKLKWVFFCLVFALLLRSTFIKLLSSLFVIVTFNQLNSSAVLVISVTISRFELQECCCNSPIAETHRSTAGKDPADRKTGSRVVRRDLRAKLPSFQSRMEQTESTDCCQAVRVKVLLFCYWLSSPKINTHLVFVPMDVFLYECNTSTGFL